MSRSTDDRYDLIVIGSGMAALACASIVSQLGMRRVLLIERHFKPGGFTHTFKRPGGYHWDVGIHYVGEMQDGTPARRLLDLITGGGVTWQQMADPFEVFDYPGLRFEVRRGAERYRDDLIRLFPDEAAALRRYFVEMTGLSRGPIAELILRDSGSGLLSTIGRVIGSGRLARLGRGRSADYFAAMFSDPRLRALLQSQWGDHGLPPGQSAMLIQAMVSSHYLDGGFYPVGGAAGIAESALRIIEKNGGVTRLRCEADEILVENGRAVGVRVKEHSGRDVVERVLWADRIVSNAGAAVTYRSLLRNRPEADAARRELDGIAPGPAHVNLFIGFKDDPRKLGFRGENHWLFDRFDHDEIFAGRDELLEGRPRFAYVTFPSLKDPGSRAHTGEIIAFASYDAFAPFREGGWKKRGAEYEALKRRMADALIDFVDARRPGYRDLIDFVEVSTPVTTEHFAGHPGGVIYGVAARPERYGLVCTHVHTPIKNLYQASADSLAHGIVGAAIGGAVAAAAVLGGGVGSAARIVRAMARVPVSEKEAGPGPTSAAVVEEAAATLE